MHDLKFLSQSLIANKGNPDQYDNILAQFMNSVTFDGLTLTFFINHPDFPTIIQCILFPILRYQIPPISDCRPKKIIFECLQFLINISYLNPHILNLVAANTPFDTVIPSFMGRFDPIMDMDKINGSAIVPFLKLLSALSTSPEINIGDNANVILLYNTLKSFFNVSELSHIALATLAGFIRNSPVSNAVLKQSIDFIELRENLSVYLTSDDIKLVLSTLCVLTLLMPQHISRVTTVKVAIESFSLADSPIVAFLASTILYELWEPGIISSDDVLLMINSLQRGGFVAHSIYNIFVDLSGLHQLVIETISFSSTFFKIVSSILDIEDGFTSISGSNFLSVVYQDKNDFPLTEEVSQCFTKALKIALTSSKFASIDRREAAVSLMRILLSIPQSVTYVIGPLQEFEEQIFLDFQRQCELNNSYISLHYFLLIFEVSELLPHWKTKLSEIVGQTQFPALLVHVLSESRNRVAIGSAVRAQHIIASNLEKDIESSFSPFFEALVSGIMVINMQKYDNKRKKTTEMLNVISSLHKRIGELEKERFLTESSLNDLQCESGTFNTSLESRLKVKVGLNKENNKLDSRLRSAKKKMRLLVEEKRIIDDRNVEIQTKLQNLETSESRSKNVNSNFKVKMNEFLQHDNKLKNLQHRKSQLQSSVKEMKKELDMARKTSQEIKRKCKNVDEKAKQSKLDFSSLLSKFDEYTTENTKLSNIRRESERTVINHLELQAKTPKVDDSAQEEIQKLAEVYEQVIIERNDAEIRYQQKLVEFNELHARMKKCEDYRKNCELLIRLIHRSTGGIGMLPKNAEKFLPSEEEC